MLGPRILAADAAGPGGPARLRFARQDAGAVSLWVDPDLAPAVQELGLLHPDTLDRLLGATATGEPGRAATAVVGLPGRPERLHLRPVRHGGWLGSLWGPWLLGPGRALAELRATATLRERGAPVPRAALAVARRGTSSGSRWPLYQVALGTIYEEGTCDGVALLASRPGRARLLRAAAAAGRAMRRFHDAGGRHADLHVKNLLWREESGEVVVIDLDRARAGAPPPAARRLHELMRLYRSLRKRGLLERVGARGCAACFGAYVGRDRALRRALLAHLPRERLRVAMHALGYRSSGPAPG